MVEMYIIVHEECLEWDVRTRRAKEVYKKLSRIKEEFPFFLINDSDNPYASDIHFELPKPDKNLKIRVCGAYVGEGWCINRQLDSLKKAGYNSEIDFDASLEYNHK